MGDLTFPRAISFSAGPCTPRLGMQIAFDNVDGGCLLIHVPQGFGKRREPRDPLLRTPAWRTSWTRSPNVSSAFASDTSEPALRRYRFAK